MQKLRWSSFIYTKQRSHVTNPRMNATYCILVIFLLIPSFNGQIEGDIRLMPEDSDYNFVQVYHDNQWGAVCSGPQWDRNDADVICRQLGRGKSLYVFTAYGSDYHHSVYDSVNTSTGEPIWLKDLRCTGNEDRIIDCERPIEWGSLSHICYRAGLECSNIESTMDSYKYVGCYEENIGGEPLLHGYNCETIRDPRCHEYGCLNRCANSLMTVELCASVCCNDFRYFGLEFHNECYCGNTNITYYMYRKSPDDKCGTPCNGNVSQNCGSNHDISLYKCGPRMLPDILESPVDGDSFPPFQGSSSNSHILKPFVMYIMIGGVVGLAVIIIVVYAVYMRKSNRSHMRQIGDVTIYCEPDRIQLPNGIGNVEKYLEAEYNLTPQKEKEQVYKASLCADGSIKHSIVRTTSEPETEEGAIGYASVAVDCMDDEYCVPIVKSSSVKDVNIKKPVAPPRQSSLEKRHPQKANNESLYAVPMKNVAGLQKKDEQKIEYYATSDVVNHSDTDDESPDYRWMSSLTDKGYTKLDEKRRTQDAQYAAIKD